MTGTAYIIHFSPAGGSAAVARKIGAAFGPEKTEVNLLADPLKRELPLEKEDTAVVVLPVYSGRIPALCIESLGKLKGRGGPAVIAAAYGNRHYDDALLELKNVMEGNGFKVISAAACVTRHSIFPKAGEGRPDSEDLRELEDFARKSAALASEFLNGGQASRASLTVPGNFPYRAFKPVPITPKTGKSCNGCGACARICPAGAISPERLKKNGQGALYPLHGLHNGLPPKSARLSRTAVLPCRKRLFEKEQRPQKAGILFPGLR